MPQITGYHHCIRISDLGTIEVTLEDHYPHTMITLALAKTFDTWDKLWGLLEHGPISYFSASLGRITIEKADCPTTIEVRPGRI